MAAAAAVAHHLRSFRLILGKFGFAAHSARFGQRDARSDRAVVVGARGGDAGLDGAARRRRAGVGHAGGRCRCGAGHAGCGRERQGFGTGDPRIRRFGRGRDGAPACGRAAACARRRDTWPRAAQLRPVPRHTLPHRPGVVDQGPHGIPHRPVARGLRVHGPCRCRHRRGRCRARAGLRPCDVRLWPLRAEEPAREVAVAFRVPRPHATELPTVLG